MTQRAARTLPINLVSSDSHVWLRPLYARLRSDHRFGLFSPAHQFETLAKAVEEDSPAKAATMREWSPAAQIGCLVGSRCGCEQPNPISEVELWRVRKGDRELHCLAVYLPSGIDVRLMEGDNFQRTQLVRDAPATEIVSKEWSAKLMGARTPRRFPRLPATLRGTQGCTVPQAAGGPGIRNVYRAKGECVVAVAEFARRLETKAPYRWRPSGRSHLG